MEGVLFACVPNFLLLLFCRCRRRCVSNIYVCMKMDLLLSSLRATFSQKFIEQWLLRISFGLRKVSFSLRYKNVQSREVLHGQSACIKLARERKKTRTTANRHWFTLKQSCYKLTISKKCCCYCCMFIVQVAKGRYWKRKRSVTSFVLATFFTLFFILFFPELVQHLQNNKTAQH